MIADRNLAPGTKLVATYKHKDYRATVQKSAEGGGVVYVLEDGQIHRSPSSAGTAITGSACSGWTFWSLDIDKPEAKATAPPKPKKDKKTEELPLEESTGKVQGAKIDMDALRNRKQENPEAVAV